MAKRGQGEGTISKREDGTWWARISLGRDENGSRKRKAFYGKTRKEVQEKLTAALNEVNNDTYIEPTKMTLEIWYDTWLKEYKKNSIKPTTFRRYWQTFTAYVKPIIGTYKLKDLRNEHVQRCINELNANGLAPSTIKYCYVGLKASIDQAVENGLVAKNVASNIKLPKSEKSDIKALSQEEQERFIEAAKGSAYGEIFILDLTTGLRIGELLALTWGDINFTEGLLKVTKTQSRIKDPHDPEDKWHCEVGTPKTKAGNRIIPLLPDIVKMLEMLRLKQIELFLRLGKPFSDKNTVFCNSYGGSIANNKVFDYFSKIRDKAGLEDATIHGCRHTFATRCLENGIELRVVQELLGHSTISITADLYTHVLPDKKKDSVMKLKNTITL